MTITWHRNPDGTSTTVVPPAAPGPQADVTLVDRTDREAVAAHRAGIAPARLPLPGEVRITSPLLLAARRAALDIEADDDGTADSHDPLDH